MEELRDKLDEWGDEFNDNIYLFVNGDIGKTEFNREMDSIFSRATRLRDIIEDARWEQKN